MSDESTTTEPQILTEDPEPEAITLTREEWEAERKTIVQQTWDKARREFLTRRARQDAKRIAMANRVAAMEQIVAMTIAAQPEPMPSSPAQTPQPEPAEPNVFRLSTSQISALGPQRVKQLILRAWTGADRK